MIATDDARLATFACETREGVCAVFTQLDGPCVQTGDIVDGAVSGHGRQTFAHADGPCRVFGETGPVSRDEALVHVRARRLQRAQEGVGDL